MIFSVPSQVNSINITGISTSELTVIWSPPDDHSYIEYYNISYTPYDCYTAQSGYINVTDHQYTITGLYSGMNYTVTVTAGNAIGESNPVSITRETVSISKLYTISIITFNITA